ncbi:ABC transporter permease [Chryseolinea sp. H1M3-3]|uniref:ABC transporter permease n=1 Tax=Chryseolinea sp. H1M3-3 TaxID=3034144 RepID=UPI0023EB4B42|nr:ABC transporter permease [Chryseolinea sp. H1M3-3]
MIKNYLLIALRNIRQSPLYAFINIFSLAIGLTACMVIYLFIQDEKSFDAFHAKKDTIYRLDEVQNFPGTNLQKVALSMPGMGPSMLKDFPEVSNYARFMCRPKQLLVREDKRFLLPYIATVDSTFLEIFDFEVLIGDRTTALDAPYSIMVTEQTALKFFNSAQEAINNTLTFQGKEYKVTGVLKQVPENSHMKFDALVSMTSITAERKEFNDQWGSNFLNTYLTINSNADIKALESKFPAFMSRHMDNPDINKFYTLFLQRLTDVHLSSTDIEHDYNNYRKFNGEYLEVFSIVGVFILLIAGLNFMNLTTARASHRWKEIGVRKTVGAKKLQLFLQFIFESTVLAFFALVLGVALSLLFVPLINVALDRQLSLFTFLESPINIIYLFVVTIGLGLITGIYPSFYMTSFNMSSVLKGGKKGNGRSVFRSGMVVVQFGLALAMIVSTLIVIQQLSFMQNKDLGFNKEQMMLVDLNDEANKKFELLRTELKRSPLILGVTASGQRLGENFHQSGFKVKADTGVFSITPSNVNVDYEYLDVYGIQLKEGRGFKKDIVTDKDMAFVINESFAKELGIKDIIGTPAGHGWYHNDSLGTIIGVAKDFNFNSLHYKINTLQMSVHPEWGYDEMSVKIDSEHAEEAIGFVKKLWDEHISYPFDYSFLDEHFEKLYRTDQQMSSVVAIMAGLAILISCMGLFGLAAITTARKVKEIGIRKVLGATEAQITMLLSKNFTFLLMISFVIASPVTYWLLLKWLESFAYRITINPLLFFLGGVIAVAIALLTISYHTVRSARNNPVDSLRYE